MNGASEQSQPSELKACIESEEEVSVVAEPIADALQKPRAGDELGDLVERASRFFREHPAILLTMLYVYASTIGFRYMWSLFFQFGINVLDFAEISDFLLASFKHPAAIFITFFVPGFATAFYVLFASLLKQIGPKRVSGRWAQAFRDTGPQVLSLAFVFVLVYSILFPSLLGGAVGKSIRYGDGLKVVVELISSDDPEMNSKLVGEIYLIGTTAKFAFFYDRDEEYTHIIPIANMLHMHNVPVEPTEVSDNLLGRILKTLKLLLGG